MNPVKELIGVLTPRPTTSGTVAAVPSPRQVLVATATGPLTCTLGINMAVKLGDKVSVSGTTIVAKLASDDDVPHFVV